MVVVGETIRHNYTHLITFLVFGDVRVSRDTVYTRFADCIN